jgi:hypothetical protein
MFNFSELNRLLVFIKMPMRQGVGGISLRMMYLLGEVILCGAVRNSAVLTPINSIRPI